MRILNISLEKKLFENSSSPQKRVFEYVKLFDRFDLLVMAGKSYSRLDFSKMSIWPTNSFSKIFYMHDAYYLGKKMIKTYGSDIVSVQDPFEMGIVGWFLAKKFGLKLQVQIHGDFFSSPYWRQESFLNRLRFYIGRSIVKKANGLRVVSQRIKKSVIELGVSEDKISVVPIFTDLRFTNPRSRTSSLRGAYDLRIRKSENKFVFLTVGRLVKVKNITMQIEAMAEVAKKYSQAELWIVGDGPLMNSLKFKVKSLKLESSVKFMGWRDDLDNFYGQADTFILSSNYEGWGMAVVEAANFELPIIMTDVGCAGEVIKDNESGIVIPVGDKSALARAMINLMEDASLRQRLRQTAAQAVGRLPNKEENLIMYKKACERAMLVYEK